jgi:hypothetical protein
LNFSEQPQTISVPMESGEWRKLVSSADTEWDGQGSVPDRIQSGGEGTLALPPHSATVYEKT